MWGWRCSCGWKAEESPWEDVVAAQRQIHHEWHNEMLAYLRGETQTKPLHP